MDESAGNDKLMAKMEDQKSKFVAKHAISQHHQKQIEAGVKIQDRVTLPRKRSASSDLEEAVSLKPDKKRKKHR